MIRINQLKLPVGHRPGELIKKAARALKIREEEIAGLHIVRQSVDARKKPEIVYSYIVDVQVKGGREEKVLAKAKNRNAALVKEKPYRCPPPGAEPLKYPPVIVGTGPAGLFCGLLLARQGYRPILLERGRDVDRRKEDVDRFWEGGALDPKSNVQFGEGGAGTFSDGKLNTLVKDVSGRNGEVLRILTEFGANPAIRYASKPHIGTDVLSQVVKAIRQEILNLGGQVRFESQVTDLVIRDGSLQALVLENGEQIPVQAAVFAVGHSARDTFSMLLEHGVPMEPKPFAVGLRIQHPQSMIDESQYGRTVKELGAASYKVTWKAAGGRGVYSFCMCPGGYVVNASSEPGRLAVNGMSYHGRAGENANSALIITVGPEDFPDETVLGGVHFQQHLEEKAYQLGKGRIPAETYGDFKAGGPPGERLGQVKPQFKGQWTFADLRELLGPELSETMIEGIEAFEHMIRGFSREDAILAGIESRTSSPVRILRDEQGESSLRGLFPCGEGAGYAGGITSAAMDGMKTAEALIRRFAPAARSDEI